MVIIVFLKYSPFAICDCISSLRKGKYNERTYGREAEVKEMETGTFFLLERGIGGSV